MASHLHHNTMLVLGHHELTRTTKHVILTLIYNELLGSPVTRRRPHEEK